MGTNCAPLVADLILYSYERDFQGGTAAVVHIYPGYSNNEFLLYDFVATRISFDCSLSPLHFTSSV